MPDPSETLVALEERLAQRLLDFERFDEAWPRSRSALDRAEIGRRREEALSDIMSLRHNIAASEAVTLADAAVQLRRLKVMDEDDLKPVIFSAPMRSLVASVLAAVRFRRAARWA